jgi:hypothetical protein
MTDNICDKCGQSVPRENDAVVCEAEAFGWNIIHVFSQSRHLAPTSECEGSPSRWRRIEAGEEPWCSAWAALNRTAA